MNTILVHDRARAAGGAPEVPLIRPDGAALIVGGLCSNLEATEAILAEADRLGIPSDAIVCTGDVVAYGADAYATAARVRGAMTHVVMGNCEESLASGAHDCGCGFPMGGVCEAMSIAWFAHARAELDAATRDWMRTLPRRSDVPLGAARLAVVHGTARAINRFVFASTPAQVKRRELEHVGVDGIVAGHCGLPFTQIVDGLLWHNAGAAGMPANDGTPRVWFSILALDGDEICVEHRALEYDHRRAAAKMRGAALPEGYMDALTSGLWPSCDVLPLAEVRARGTALEPATVRWRPPDRSRIRPSPVVRCETLWPAPAPNPVPRLAPRKFIDPEWNADGQPRARVALKRLSTLWFNTGTLCNIACRGCYIESSPSNDALAYLMRADLVPYLDEIAHEGLDTDEIGFTGGEPFMNPDIIPMIEECLSRGFRLLVLTNAMRPMRRHAAGLCDLNRRFGRKLALRVSLDHYTPERHEDERGADTFRPALDGLLWLAAQGFHVSVAGRTMWGEDAQSVRAGYERLFATHELALDAHDPSALVLFPEMDAAADVPEISAACWDVLGKSPESVMCASSRMVVRRKDEAHPVVVACTLVPYDRRFELGGSLKEAARSVALNHPHCARFCVLGGASCTSRTAPLTAAPTCAK
jgi:predicted phosphodiesterase